MDLNLSNVILGFNKILIYINYLDFVTLELEGGVEIFFFRSVSFLEGGGLVMFNSKFFCLFCYLWVWVFLRVRFVVWFWGWGGEGVFVFVF